MMKPRGFRVHIADNVATLLDDAVAGPVECVGCPGSPELTAREAISRGHKIALAEIGAGGAVVKFGVCIGHTTKPIARGDWVHLHNLASDLDQRSATLDLHSGAPTDTNSAYV